MAFTVQEFHDLIQLLEQHPEWRTELRRLLLTDALLSLPEQLAEAQRRAEARLTRLEETVTQLAEAQRRAEARLTRLEETVTQLAESQRRAEARLTRLEETVAQLAEAQRRATEQLTSLTATVRTLVIDVGDLKGDNLERRYRERAPAYFGRLIRRVRVISPEELDILLEEAVARGTLSEAEAEEVIWADLVVRGRRREDDVEVYLVVEVSVGVGPHDVERAARRAALLTQTGVTALPVVAGKAVTDEATRLIRSLRVWQLINGHVAPPDNA